LTLKKDGFSLLWLWRNNIGCGRGRFRARAP
jgi:hypothetical protein